MVFTMIFGTEDCDSCKIAVKLLDEYELSKEFVVVYVDAKAEETQKLCDLYGVDELPHIVTIDPHNFGHEPVFVAIGLEQLAELVKIMDNECEEEGKN